MHNDTSVSHYTGFPSYDIFLAFFTFLGPAVNCLHYWGSSTKKRVRKRKTKLTPVNQLFMVLVKLRLDLTFRDLAYRFQISQATVSRYFITWVCFLYQQLREIEWFPSKEHTLPHGRTCSLHSSCKKNIRKKARTPYYPTHKGTYKKHDI